MGCYALNLYFPLRSPFVAGGCFGSCANVPLRDVRLHLDGRPREGLAQAEGDQVSEIVDVNSSVYTVRRVSIQHNTGISNQIRTKFRDWAIWQARAGCYSQAALSSNDLKTL